jgi:hypothetical protein
MDVDAPSDPSVYGEHASSLMDVDADSDPSVYGTKDVLTPNMSVDADSDPSVYGTKDVPTPNMSVNETSESAPDGQNHLLIEDEIDSVASHGELTHRVVTQTQQAHATTQAVPQAVPPVDVGDDALVVPRPESTLIFDTKGVYSSLCQGLPYDERNTVLIRRNPGSCLSRAAGKALQTAVLKLER